MKVREVMSRKIVSISPQTSFLEVWNLLFKKHVHALPVVNPEKKLLGIIVIGDVIARLYPSYQDTMEEFLQEASFEDLEDKIEKAKKLTASELMNKEIHFCYEDDAVLKAFSKMVVRRLRQLPVVTQEIKLVGVVSKRDVFDKLLPKRTS